MEFSYLFYVLEESAQRKCILVQKWEDKLRSHASMIDESMNCIPICIFFFSLIESLKSQCQDVYIVL